MNILDGNLMFVVAMVSTLTALGTESLKPILLEFKMEFKPNIVAVVLSTLMSIIYGVGYANKIGLSLLDSTLYILVLIYMSWLSSMLGYDKVIQTFSQFKKER